MPLLEEIELKRIVMVKAVVTRQFKDNLIAEIKRGLRNVEGELQSIAQQFMAMIEQARMDGADEGVLAGMRSRLDEEMGKRNAAKADMERKVFEAQRLELGSEFTQGPLEGPVTVRLGENLYQRIGGVEILVEDGEIREIREAD